MDTSLFKRSSSKQQQKLLVLKQTVRTPQTIKPCEDFNPLRKQKSTAVRIWPMHFMFSPQVPLPDTIIILRAILLLHIQRLGAPSPFPWGISCGKAGIINVTRGSIRPATWRDQEGFLRLHEPSSCTHPQYEIKACHVRYPKHNMFRSSVSCL